MGKKQRKSMNKIREHTSVGTIEALNGMGFPTTVSSGLSYNTRPIRLWISSSDRSSGDTWSGSNGPLYNHIGHVLSANGMTR